MVECQFAQYPMVCFRLLKNRSVLILMIQNLLTGVVQFANQYYLPIYLQNAHGLSPSMSAVLVIPLPLAQAISSIGIGLLMSRYTVYRAFIICGFALWTVGISLQILLSRRTPVYWIVLIQIIAGIGLGSTMQPTLVAAQANCDNADRAIITSMRNLFRQFSGAMGMAACAALFKNVFESSLSASDLTELNRELIQRHAFDLRSLAMTIDSTSQSIAARALSNAVRAVFILFAPMLLVCFLLSWFIKDKSLKCTSPTSSAGQSVLEKEV